MSKPGNSDFGILGLCMRAGKLVTGAQAVEKAVKRGEAAMAVVDAAASNGTKKIIADACAYARVDWAVLPAGVLARETGKPGRMAAAVTDASFAKAMEKRLLRAEQSDTIEGCI